jgi:DNA-binding HxlR family transcriptional regulator
MPARRTYGDPCGIARALDVVGDRWALLVIRELLLGPKRFTDMRAGLPHLGPDILSQRLRELEEAGVVRRDTLPPPAGSRVYELTEWGQQLEPVVLGLGRWGTRAPFPPGDLTLSPDSLVLALKTMFEPAAADGISATYELRLSDQRFNVRVADGRMNVRRGSADQPVATIAAEHGALEQILWHGRRLRAAVRAGEVTILGDRGAAERFLCLFGTRGAA